MPIERFELDTDQWAVVPRALHDYRIPLFTQICYGEHAEKLWRDFLADAPRPEPVHQSCAECGPVDDGTALYCVRCIDSMQKPTPRPVPTPIPTSERLPTEADADCDGLVWVWHSQNREWLIWQWSGVGKIGDFTHWQPTGLTRPAEPDGGNYPECSGNPASCPENEGYGCCKSNPAAPDGGAV